MVAFLMTLLVPFHIFAQEKVEKRVTILENQVEKLNSSIEGKSSIGAVLFLYGVFCALWAQNTGRNPWLWFITGMLFSVITAIVLLVKNSDDRKLRSKQPPPQEPLNDPGPYPNTEFRPS